MRATIEPRAGLGNELVRELGALVSLVEVHRPSLDDVFFALTQKSGADR